MKQNKTTHALWFNAEDGKSEHVITYYKNIFGDNFEAKNSIPLGETPSGYAEMCNIKIFDKDYLIMTTAIEHHKFNDTFAIMIHCDNQQEIDKYWNYFTEDGKESQCGWCNDKFGLRWQIIPNNMRELMMKPNAGSVMMKQTKIIIDEYHQ
jgi:predicted 3-demethylubiquinone-9 3-methyltransferase (glyoxalase superfamily)